MTLYEEAFPQKKGGRYPLNLKIKKFAQTITVTVQPYQPNMQAVIVYATDVPTGTQYTYEGGAWNATPYITPGNNNLKIVVAVQNVGNATADATVTVTPSGQSAQTQTVAGVASGDIIPTNAFTFNMPSAALPITIAVSP